MLNSDRQNEWRIVMRTIPNGHRIAVGQRTAVRDEISRDGALHTAFPLIGLVPLLILLIGFVIRHALEPVMRGWIEINCRRIKAIAESL